MRLHLFLASILLVSLLPAAPLAGAADAKSKWTVLIYLDADNDLEASGMVNMREIESVGPAPGVRVLVQMDRVPGHDASDGDWTGTHRYEMVKGSGDPERLASPVLEDMGEIDMGVPKTLQDFLVWGVARAPAEHYLVILWDHGAAWDGIASDDTSGNILSNADVHTALSGAAQASGVAKWDLLDMDACLMGNAEAVHAVSTDAGILVGSEELVPGLGLPYPTLMQTLDAQPSISAKDLAAALLPAYKARYAADSPSPDADAVLTSFDLTAEPAFWTALTSLSSAIAAHATTDWPQIVKAARASDHFRKPDLKNSEAIDVVDFANRLGQASVDSTIKAAALAVVDASRPFILSATTSPGHPGALGITMRFGVPDAGEATPAATSQPSSPATASDPANAAQQAIAQAALSDVTEPAITQFALNGETVVTPTRPVMFDATALDANLLSLDGALIQKINGKEYIVQFLAPQATRPASDGPGLSADFAWNGHGTTLSNGEKTLVAPAYHAGASNEWIVDGSYRFSGQTASFNASLDFDKNGQLLHAWDVSGAASEIRPALGDAFAPTYLAIASDGSDTDATGDFLTAGAKSWNLVTGPLAPGPYQLAIYADDLAGNVNLSEPRMLTLQDAAPVTPPQPVTPTPTPTSTTLAPTAPPPSATPAPTEAPTAPPSRSPGPSVALLVAAAAVAVALIARRRRG